MAPTQLVNSSKKESLTRVANLLEQELGIDKRTFASIVGTLLQTGKTNRQNVSDSGRQGTPVPKVKVRFLINYLRTSIDGKLLV